jgi:hypothetical protein
VAPPPVQEAAAAYRVPHATRLVSCSMSADSTQEERAERHACARGADAASAGPAREYPRSVRGRRGPPSAVRHTGRHDEAIIQMTTCNARAGDERGAAAAAKHNQPAGATHMRRAPCDTERAACAAQVGDATRHAPEAEVPSPPQPDSESDSGSEGPATSGTRTLRRNCR